VLRFTTDDLELEIDLNGTGNKERIPTFEKMKRLHEKEEKKSLPAIMNGDILEEAPTTEENPVQEPMTATSTAISSIETMSLETIVPEASTSTEPVATTTLLIKRNNRSN
jgi:hypothetical protein